MSDLPCSIQKNWPDVSFFQNLAQGMCAPNMGLHGERVTESYNLQGERGNPEYPQKIANKNLEPALQPDAPGIPVDNAYWDSSHGS